MERWHCVKSVQYAVSSGPYLPVFELNTEKFGPEKTPYFGHFSHSVGNGYLEGYRCFVLKISRSLRFCEIHRFQSL